MSDSKSSGNNHLNHDTASLKNVTSFVKGTTFYGNYADTSKPKESNKKK